MATEIFAAPSPSEVGSKEPLLCLPSLEGLEVLSGQGGVSQGPWDGCWRRTPRSSAPPAARSWPCRCLGLSGSAAHTCAKGRHHLISLSFARYIKLLAWKWHGQLSLQYRNLAENHADDLPDRGEVSEGQSGLNPWVPCPHQKHPRVSKRGSFAQEHPAQGELEPQPCYCREILYKSPPSSLRALKAPSQLPITGLVLGGTQDLVTPSPRDRREDPSSPGQGGQRSPDAVRICPTTFGITEATKAQISEVQIKHRLRPGRGSSTPQP